MDCENKRPRPRGGGGRLVPPGHPEVQSSGPLANGAISQDAGLQGPVKWVGQTGEPFSSSRVVGCPNSEREMSASHEFNKALQAEQERGTF